ncbi:MAG: hypothetical protein KIT74_00685 [Fimbriimonadales bacterium]|nr:hypothetical protein [Fimbriimonadales bacterium]
MRVSGVYEDDRLERFAAMPREHRLGNLASNLVRIASYCKNRRPTTAIVEIAREARHFLEICVASEEDVTLFAEVDAFLDSVIRALRENRYPDDDEVSWIAVRSELLIRMIDL